MAPLTGRDVARLIASCFVLASCGDSAGPPAAAEVVDVAWLAPRLGAVQVLDVRGQAVYAEAHIPGAHNLDEERLRATVEGVPGQVAPRAQAEAALRETGLTRERPIVVYGAETDLASARTYWTLLFYGHPEVKLLDGGLRAWREEGRAVETGPVTFAASSYAVSGERPELRVDVPWLLPRLGRADLRLVDARSTGEYGAGHLPGARNVDWTRNIRDGRLLPEPELRALYPDLATAIDAVAYCQTGSRGAVAFLVLRKLAPSSARLYDGSWAEWGSRPELPREP